LKRRDFITLLGGVAAWPLAARAQQPGERRIGVLMGTVETDPEAHARVAAFRQGLREIGWVEGSNIRIEFRWVADDTSLMRAYAAELVGLAPDIIVAHSPPSLAAGATADPLRADCVRPGI
jgi:putative tryptophan/tyrosine transport system substrate-binding protein